MKHVIYEFTVLLSVLCFSTPAQTVWTNAVSLDGADDYIQAPAGIWFSSEFTVEVWVRARSYNDWSRIIDFGNGAPLDNVLLTLSAGSGGYPALYVYRGESQEHLTSPIPIPLHQWVHLAATLKNGTATLYMDGAAVASGPVHAPVPVLRLNNYIGRSPWFTDSYLAADLDDLRIWNVARTAEEIALGSQQPLSGEESSLAAYWKFDEGSGTATVDASGDGQDSTLHNGIGWFMRGLPLVTPPLLSDLASTRLSLDGTVNPNGQPTTAWFEWGTSGTYGSSSATIVLGSGSDYSAVSAVLTNLAPATTYYCRLVASNHVGMSAAEISEASVATRGGAAVSFNNQSNQHAAVSSIGGLAAGNTPHTVEAWVWLPELPTNGPQRILTLGQENHAHGWILNPDGSCSIGMPGGSQVNTALTPGIWTHVAAAFDGSQLRVCTNGVLAGVTNAAFDLQGIPLTLAQTGSGENYFTGKIDELRLWNHARTEAEVHANHRAVLTGNESGLLAYWRFNEGFGSNAADATGNGNDLTLSTMWGPGVDSRLTRRPRLQLSNEADESILQSDNAVAGRFYRIATTTNLNVPWEWVPNELPMLAPHAEIQCSLPVDEPTRFYRWEVDPICYGIADIMVTDTGSPVPSEYSGLTYNISTEPFIPGEVGTQIIGADVNEGAPGSGTRIWAKYRDLNPALNARQRILTDIAVVEWPYAPPCCPDGHALYDASPICPDGWQRASGSSHGITGALTYDSAGSTHKGLCVRYRPVGEILTNNLYYVEKVGLNIIDNAAYPTEKLYWEHSMNIHRDCCSQFVYVRNAKRTIAPYQSQENADKLATLTKYAPLVWLAADGGDGRDDPEPFQPSSVEWAFPYLERFLNTDGNYWLRTVESLSSPSSVIDAFYGGVDSAPVYAFWVDKSSDESIVDLVYFFYYPYNRGKSVASTIFGSHVGDWEHITVRLTSGQPSQIYVSAHNFGGAEPWDSVTKTNSTHPVIYSAWGSHGCWLDAGNHHYDTVEILGIGLRDLIDVCNAGTAWNTWERVEAFDYNAQTGLGASPWPAWMSTDFRDPGSGDPSVPGNGPVFRWGNPREGKKFGYYRLTDGPTGPASKGVWNPYVFQ